MVLQNELQHQLRDLLLLRKADPVRDVLPDDRRGRLGLQLVVRVPAAVLVLHEIVRFQHLADVVVQHADTTQQPVGADLVRSRLCKVRDVDRVRVRTGCVEGQPFQKRTRGVCPFEQGLIRRDS